MSIYSYEERKERERDSKTKKESTMKHSRVLMGDDSVHIMMAPVTHPTTTLRVLPHEYK
jgi:hypothetical protein